VNQWATLRVMRDDLPSDRAAEQAPAQPPPHDRSFRPTPEMSQFGAAVAGAVAGQILNHIH
jgi:hypothetical protein